MNVEPIFARCHQAVVQSDAEFHWQLDATQQLQYATALASCMHASSSDDHIRTAAINYHLDHRRVAALRDAQDLHHDQLWSDWLRHAQALIHARGLGRSGDQSVEIDDLAQVAARELFRALPNYRYQSRLNTWAYSVIGRSVQRHTRGGRAKKRSAQPDSLEQLAESDMPLDPAPGPEVGASVRSLVDRITEILNSYPDRRLVVIFALWAYEDRSLSDIGAYLSLSLSRTRALLKLARDLLRADPEIRDWLDPEGHADE